jgi:hypothetical protein
MNFFIFLFFKNNTRGMYSLVPQILHMKDKTPNSSSQDITDSPLSLSSWLLGIANLFLFFFSLSMWPHWRPSPPRRPTAQGRTQKWISYSKPMDPT